MGAGSRESHHAIATLMYRHAECVDQADFDGLSEIFAHGRIGTASVESAEVVPPKA